MTRILGVSELEQSRGPRTIDHLPTLFFGKKISVFEIYFCLKEGE